MTDPGGNGFQTSWDVVANNPTPNLGGTYPVLDQAACRHNSLCNVVFVDGHVKSVRVDFLNTKAADGALKYYTIEAD